MLGQDTTSSPFAPLIDPIVQKTVDSLYPKLEPIIKEEAKNLALIVAGGIILAMGLGYSLSRFERKS